MGDDHANRGAELLRDLEDAARALGRSSLERFGARELLGKLLDEIAGLHAKADPTPQPPFETHRVRGAGAVQQTKTLAAFALRPFTRFLFQRQAAFNDRALRLLSDLVGRVGALADRLVVHERQLGALREQVRRDREELAQQMDVLHLKLDVRQGGPASSAAYLAFEERFRGPEGMIKERVQRYVPILQGLHGPALDLGCGRGELLEVLRDAGISAQGIDSNQVMVDRCKSKGLLVERCDLLEGLEALPPDSLGAVVAIQVVEHLTHRQIDRLVELTRTRVRPGGLFLVETINPHCLEALKFYFADPTHRNLVYPELMEFFLEQHELTNIQTVRIHPVGEAQRLPLPEAPELRPTVDRLNDVLFGPQDYYTVARRPADGAAAKP
jgi:SAM-dependent methyltransferase